MADPIAAKDALSTLLATEALLLAASTLAATIGHAPRDNTPKTKVPRNTARAVAWLMVVVSLGGLAAWIELYPKDKGWDNGWAVFESIGLLIPLAAIPAIGFLCVQWSSPPSRLGGTA